MVQEHNAVTFVLSIKKCFCKRMRASYSKPLKLFFVLLAWDKQTQGQYCTGTLGTHFKGL